MRGGLTTKIMAMVDALGILFRFVLLRAAYGVIFDVPLWWRR